MPASPPGRIWLARRKANWHPSIRMACARSACLHRVIGDPLDMERERDLIVRWSASSLVMSDADIKRVGLRRWHEKNIFDNFRTGQPARYVQSNTDRQPSILQCAAEKDTGRSRRGGRALRRCVLYRLISDHICVVAGFGRSTIWMARSALFQIVPLIMLPQHRLDVHHPDACLLASALR